MIELDTSGIVKGFSDKSQNRKCEIRINEFTGHVRITEYNITDKTITKDVKGTIFDIIDMIDSTRR